MLFEVEPRRPNRASYAEMMGVEPASRTKDPLPSYVAGDRLKRAGISGRQRIAVYHALRANPGVTSMELAQIMGSDRYTPSRRLPELRQAGWVTNGRRRKCRVSKIVSDTWFVSRPWAKGQSPQALVPSRAAANGASAPCPSTAAMPPAESPGPVTTPEDRLRLRRELAGQDSPAGQFLRSLTPGELDL